MIENAIDVEEFERKIDKMKECDVVCYCTIGYRSSMYVRQKMASNVNSSVRLDITIFMDPFSRGHTLVVDSSIRKQVKHANEFIRLVLNGHVQKPPTSKFNSISP